MTLLPDDEDCVQEAVEVAAGVVEDAEDDGAEDDEDDEDEAVTKMPICAADARCDEAII